MQDYKNYLILQGSSENTIKDYISKTKLVLSKVKEINQDSINTFLLTIKSNKAQNTFNKYLAVLRSYFKFKKLDIKLPKDIKVNKKLPKVITQEFFENTIIPIVREISTRPYRDVAIFYFLFYTGIRVGEIEKVNRKNIDLEKREVIITSSKSKSQHIIYLPERVIKHIEIYFGLESQHQNAFNISAKAVQERFRRLNPYVEGVNLHPHLFRASFATMYLERGGDIVHLSKLLGHKNISTTMRYIALHDIKTKSDYDKAIQ